jgi:hypothetical protein
MTAHGPGLHDYPFIGEPPQPPPPPEPPRKRWYRRWPAWIGIGVIAVFVTALIAGLAGGGGSKPTAQPTNPPSISLPPAQVAPPTEEPGQFGLGVGCSRLAARRARGDRGRDVPAAAGASERARRARQGGRAMSLVIRKRLRLSPNSWLNLGLRGMSASIRAGRVTASTTGRMSVRLFPGASWRFGGKSQ